MLTPGEQNRAADRMVRLQVEARDVRDRRVLAAMGRVPRHLFVPPGSQAAAYDDHPLAIGHGQTISQPFIVAFMTEALGLRGHERVLEVGTGSGYQAAILAELCAEVFSVERIPELAEGARKVLAELGYSNVTVRTGDGSEGWAGKGPFDAIIVTAAAPEVPAALRDQLADNGLLVLPVGDIRGAQELVVISKVGDSFSMRASIGCRFVPLLGRGGFPEPGR
jgi:protein-L-isoaspartate(D-aspartate) O-methyltransferase